MRWLVPFLIGFGSIWAQPSQVILLCPAERPVQGNFLSLKGRERAAALVPRFLGLPSLSHHGRPSAIFAMRPSETNQSILAEQTVMELADSLDLPLQTEFGYGQTAEMVEKIKTSAEYEGKMVLICWVESEIPKLAAQLGATDHPKRWGEQIFDRFWILLFDSNGAVKFQNMAQKLLYGDSRA